MSKITYAFVGIFDPDSITGSVIVLNTANNTVVGDPIPTGVNPLNISITPDGDYAYVSDYDSDNVYIINTINKTVDTVVPVGHFPGGIAFTPDGRYAYVAVGDNSEVSLIDTITKEIAGSPIPVDSSPNGVAMAPDGFYAYVSIDFSSEVSAINTATNNVDWTISVSPDIALSTGIVASPNGYVFVANSLRHQVAVITLADQSVEWIPVGDYPWGVAIAPDGSYVYVTNVLSNNVSVINTTTKTVDYTINVGDYPYHIALTPDGRRAYVTNNGSKNLSIIDTETKTVIGDPVSVPGEPAGIAIATITTPNQSISRGIPFYTLNGGYKIHID